MSETPPPTPPPGNEPGPVGIPSNPPPAPTEPPAAPEFSSLVPEGYKDKPWMKGVDSVDKLFQQLDGAQKLIGQKLQGIPKEDATPEEWNSFYNTIGRPEKADAYEFDNAPEGYERNDALMNKAKEIFHEAGLSSKQAKLVQTKYEQALAEMNGEYTTKINKEFDDLALEHFGQNKDQVINTAKKLIEEHAPKDFHAHVSSLDNKSLLAMASVLNVVHEKYIKEDGAPRGSGGQPLSGMDLRAERMKIFANPAFKNPWAPEHAQLKARLDEIAQIERKINRG